MICTVCPSNNSWNNSSHSHRKDKSELHENTGNMRAIISLCRNCGSSSINNFEEFMLDPFGNPTWTGGGCLSLLVCVASECR